MIVSQTENVVKEITVHENCWLLHAVRSGV